MRTLPGGGGKITCPTLLATECRYCLATGHTVKFCPAIEQRDKFLEKKKKMDMVATNGVASEKTMKTGSMFDVLAADDCGCDYGGEGEESEEGNGDKVSWAMIAAAPPVPKAEPFCSDMLLVSSPKTLPPSVIRRQTTSTAWALAATSKKFTKIWADYSDSDSDESTS
ncbi:MAG: hypothetical protein WCI63_04085 [bacterium]